MYNHPIERLDIKMELLHQEILAVAENGFSGISRNTAGHLAHFTSEPDQATKDAIDAVIANHDPTALTADEQAEMEAKTYAETLKTEWYSIITADPTAIQSALIDIQTKLTEAGAALQGGDTATGIIKMYQAQVVIAQLGQTAMQHNLVLTKVLREVMRRGIAKDILTEPENL